MSDELDQLRADLEALDRISGLWVFTEGFRNEWFEQCEKLRDKIARLEAEQAEKADPWREAKRWADSYRGSGHAAYMTRKIVEYIDHLTAENQRLAARVAELEGEPEFTPAVLKRADEVSVGDVVLAGGMIRTVTDIDSTNQIQRIIRCDGWMAWFYNGDLVAVLPRPLVEAKTLADMQPPFEGPIVGLEPILDPARVLATAADMAYRKADFEFAKQCCSHMSVTDWKTAKPYRVKGADDGK